MIITINKFFYKSNIRFRFHISYFLYATVLHDILFYPIMSRFYFSYHCNQSCKVVGVALQYRVI